MWLIMGTSPQLPEGELIYGGYEAKDSTIVSESGVHLHLERGIETLATAAALICAHFNAPPPHILCAGDKGRGTGSAVVYDYFAQNFQRLHLNHAFKGVTFHYLFPDVDGHSKVFMALQALPSKAQRPLLVADAGFMYVAKMSGYADYYDLFTPDLGEMAFLADEMAPHPFYTRGFLLNTEQSAEQLLSRALAHANVAKNLIIKGSTDYVVQGKNIVYSMDSPSVPSMEAIGGTGDLISGIASGLLAAGFTMHDACILAVKTNRELGILAKPTPATQVHELTPFLIEALEKCL